MIETHAKSYSGKNSVFLVETHAKSYSGKNSVFLVYMCLVYMCMRVLMYLYLSLYI